MSIVYSFSIVKVFYITMICHISNTYTYLCNIFYFKFSSWILLHLTTGRFELINMLCFYFEIACIKLPWMWCVFFFFAVRDPEVSPVPFKEKQTT